MIATVTLNPSLDEWMELPSLRVGALNRAVGSARYPGGKGINVARVLHELGERAVAFGLAGGEDGRILRALLHRLAIRQEFVTVRGSTRNNYKIRTVHPLALTEINTDGPAVSGEVLQSIERRLIAHRRRLRVVVLSGSLPPGAPRTIYHRWIIRLRRFRIPTVLDTSGPALRHGVAARPWMIKPNRQEAEELLQTSLTNISRVALAARRLLRRGPAVVILSLGREGALLASSTPSGCWLARAPRVRVQSSVGAGDSLVGGFVAGWVRGRSLLEAFQLGVACGTATAMTPGTELCHRVDVRRLLSRVAIRRID